MALNDNRCREMTSNVIRSLRQKVCKYAIMQVCSYASMRLCDYVSMRVMCSVLYQENIPYLIQIGYYAANPNLTKRESKCPV